MEKISRFIKALASESRKRIPYVFLVLAVVFLAQFVKLNYQTAQGVQIAKDNSADAKSLLKKVAALSADNKKLAEQNNRLATQNAAHIDCIASLFARYTRDHQPIVLYDLNTCTAIASRATAVVAQEPAKTTTINKNKNQNSPHSQLPLAMPAPGPKKALGLTLCVPLTAVCIR
jgi:cell division protein FtsB